MTMSGVNDKCVDEAKEYIKLTEQTSTGSKNVRILHQCGKVKEFTNQLQRCPGDIMGLEVRCRGFDEGRKLPDNGEDARHEHDVGFLVLSRLVEVIISCTAD